MKLLAVVDEGDVVAGEVQVLKQIQAAESFNFGDQILREVERDEALLPPPIEERLWEAAVAP